MDGEQKSHLSAEWELKIQHTGICQTGKGANAQQEQRGNEQKRKTVRGGSPKERKTLELQHKVVGNPIRRPHPSK